MKARLSSYCTKRANNGVNLVTSRKINTRLARPIGKFAHLGGNQVFPGIPHRKSVKVADGKRLHCCVHDD